MKRIITSGFLLIGALALLSTATVAYFSDTETSSGNVFIAGAIDLKVDHTHSTYNDLMCDDGVWVPVCSDVGPNLVLNPSFEAPIVTSGTGRQIFPSGTVGLDWTVVRRTTGVLDSLELHKNFTGWTSGDALQHAELDANVSTRIFQNIATIPGSRYHLTFKFSPRPSTIAAENHIQVEWGGTIGGGVGPVAGTTSPSWAEYSFTFTATSSVTRLGFADMGTANGSGTLLDQIILREYVCPASPFIGSPCQTWQEKDLTQDKFFNFGDIKPGDHGTDVISVHVYDNDAFACLFLTNVEDVENTNLPPEQIAGDSSSPDGELEENLQFVFWIDDGDGLYEPLNGENILGGDALFNMETIPLHDSNIGSVLQATTTEYIGSAWCAGIQHIDVSGTILCDGTAVGNETQSDTLTVDLALYAVQSRNNPAFICENTVLSPPQP